MEETTIAPVATEAPQSTASSMLATEAPAVTTASDVAAQPTQSLGGWYTSIKDEDLRAYAEGRGFCTQEELVSAYKQLEDLGLAEKAGKTLTLPDAEDIEGYGKLYDKLGRPAKPEDYKLVGDGQQPTEFTNAMAKLMHEHGISGKQAEALSAQYNAMAANMQAAQDKQFEIESANQMELLQKEWGSNYGRNVEMFKRGVKGLGISNEEFASVERALGTKRAVEMFKNAASGTGEASFHGDGSSNGFMSPSAANAELSRLTADKDFGKRILSGDIAAMDKFERLNRMAMGE